MKKKISKTLDKQFRQELYATYRLLGVDKEIRFETFCLFQKYPIYTLSSEERREYIKSFKKD